MPSQARAVFRSILVRNELANRYYRVSNTPARRRVFTWKRPVMKIVITAYRLHTMQCHCLMKPMNLLLKVNILKKKFNLKKFCYQFPLLTLFNMGGGKYAPPKTFFLIIFFLFALWTLYLVTFSIYGFDTFMEILVHFTWRHHKL